MHALAHRSRRCTARERCKQERRMETKVLPSPACLRRGALITLLAFGVAACTQAQPVGRGTATLSWAPVTKRSDGAALTDLAGYRIYYGTSPAAVTRTVVLADPKATSYVVTRLTPGTWYFAVAAYTRSGTEGRRSDVGSKTIR
jgi:hypothetical protein